MNRVIKGLLILTALLMLCSCEKWRQEKDRDHHRNVFILYAASFNNLSSNIENNIKDMVTGEVPQLKGEDAVYVISHKTAHNYDYDTKTSPCIYRIYTKKEELIRDTIKVFEAGTNSADPDFMRTALQTIKTKSPADHYGMLVSSHGTGWIPPNYKEATTSIFSLREDDIQSEYPLTKAVCVYAESSTQLHWMELSDFADAIPMKMDYIIFDACLMGGIEVAYQLRNVCNTIICSPAEILAEGMIYPTLLSRLLKETPELEALCQEYYDHYNAMSGYYQSATITLVETSGLENLANCCKNIFDKYHNSILNMDSSSVQAYFYDNKHWFYDLRHFIVKLGATDDELKSLDKALDQCIKYKAATESFFNLKLNNVCGLSTYIPRTTFEELNQYYSKLDWNKATSLVN